MGTSFLEKLLPKYWRKYSGVNDRPLPSSYRELPRGTDYRRDALLRVSQELKVGENVAQELVRRFPDLEMLIGTFRSSYQKFAETGITPDEGYLAFRSLYFNTQGASNDLISENLSKTFRKPTIPQTFSSVFGSFIQTDVLRIVRNLRTAGIAQLESTVGPEHLREFNKATGFDGSEKGCGVVEETPIRSFVKESSLLSIPVVNRIAADPLFYFVAGEYLETQPIFVRPAVWTSRPHSNSYENLSESAQLFHVDMSNPKFFQVFLYLNDVDDNNGPHCAIPGTHRAKARELWRDGRISDEEMASFYSRDTWRTEKGPAGTLFIVDTVAFHKGLAPVAGERRICSLYYANTLFGQHLPVTSDTPAFDPVNFGEQVADFSPRFLSRFASAS
ncbi:MAG: hypothetical protein JOZ08_15070 [Verrucomicrobia bacterium]|nr:hypothetical protein [Verrucomicrobiota bacterium]MBV8276695.1 hypothetical protein [Verrucomicrobiota bacterium]